MGRSAGAASYRGQASPCAALRAAVPGGSETPSAKSASARKVPATILPLRSGPLRGRKAHAAGGICIQVSKIAVPPASCSLLPLRDGLRCAAVTGVHRFHRSRLNDRERWKRLCLWRHQREEGERGRGGEGEMRSGRRSARVSPSPPPPVSPSCLPVMPPSRKFPFVPAVEQGRRETEKTHHRSEAQGRQSDGKGHDASR